MNIFALSTDPSVAARMMCDKHIPKMIVESAQMMASAIRRHQDSVLSRYEDEGYMSINELFAHRGIVTKKGFPYVGGYKNHPCTVWAGDNWTNFMWLARHAKELLVEFSQRYGSNLVQHACTEPVMAMHRIGRKMYRHQKAGVNKTPFAMAMPDKYKRAGKEVLAYRHYYYAEKAHFAKWERGRARPDWWTMQLAAEQQTQERSGGYFAYDGDRYRFYAETGGDDIDDLFG